MKNSRHNRRCALLCGLAAAVAMVAAFAMTTTASAVSLCAAEQTECANESSYPNETAIVGSATNSTFKTSLGSLTCGKSTFAGVTIGGSGEPLPAEVTALTFSECKLGLLGCTVTAVNLPYQAPISYSGSGDGQMKVASGGTGNPGAKVACSSSVSCTITAAEIPFTVLGGNPATAEPGATTYTATGEICPKEISWTAKYELSAPKPAFVAQNPRPTVLCKAKESPCAGGGNLHKAGTAITFKKEANQLPVLEYEWDGAVKTFRCEKIELKMETSFDKGTPKLEGQLNSLTFGTCNNGCTAVEALNLPWDLQIEANPKKLGDGYIDFVDGGSGVPNLRVKCAGTCVYRTSDPKDRTSGVLAGAASASAIVGDYYNLVKTGSDAKCGAGNPGVNYAFTWKSVLFDVTAPANLWVVNE